MESYKSTSVTKRYFNFLEIWTDQAWLARKTQCWAGASFLCYENLPHLSSPHISFSLHSQTAKSSESKLVTMVKLQATKIQEYAVTGYSIKSRVKTTTFCHRLLHSACGLHVVWDGTQKASWSISAAAGSSPVRGTDSAFQFECPCFSLSSSGQDSDTLINKETDYKLIWYIVVMGMAYMTTHLFSFAYVF